jgi:capsular polysaccharide biosynthesis protein
MHSTPADNGTMEQAVSESTAPEPAAEAEPEPVTQPTPVVAPEPVATVERDVFRGPLESALRHPILTLLPLIAAIALAAAIAYQRDPIYTAAARINVGRVDVPAYTLSDTLIGNATLAASYSRAIAAPAVAEVAGKKAHVPPLVAQSHITASQVPRSTLIEVQARGASSGQAITLANAGSQALIDYVTKLNLRQQQNRDINQYRAAARKVQNALTKVQLLTLKGAIRSSKLRPKLARARAELATRQAKAQSLGIRLNQGAQAPETKNLLQLAVPANRASSDRSNVLQEMLIIGAAAGLVLGLALALLATNWRYLRSVRK